MKALIVPACVVHDDAAKAAAISAFLIVIANPYLVPASFMFFNTISHQTHKALRFNARVKKHIKGNKAIRQ